MANEVLSSAGAGASAGAFGGPVGIGVGAAIGAIAGFASSRSARKKAKRARRRLRRAQMFAAEILKPENILKEATKVTPKFRAAIASGVGPGIEQRVGSGLARSGFTDTGAGEAIRALSASVPGVLASQGAMEFATENARQRAAAILSGQPFAEDPSSGIPAWIAALQGGLTGGLATSLFQGPRTQSTVPGGIPTGPFLPGGTFLPPPPGRIFEGLPTVPTAAFPATDTSALIPLDDPRRFGIARF